MKSCRWISPLWQVGSQTCAEEYAECAPGDLGLLHSLPERALGIKPIARISRCCSFRCEEKTTGFAMGLENVSQLAAEGNRSRFVVLEDKAFMVRQGDESVLEIDPFPTAMAYLVLPESSVDAEGNEQVDVAPFLLGFLEQCLELALAQVSRWILGVCLSLSTAAAGLGPLKYSCLIAWPKMPCNASK